WFHAVQPGLDPARSGAKRRSPEAPAAIVGAHPAKFIHVAKAVSLADGCPAVEKGSDPKKMPKGSDPFFNRSAITSRLKTRSASAAKASRSSATTLSCCSRKYSCG